VKLFLVQLINTAFLTLFINANLNYFYGSSSPPALPRSGAWAIFTGPYDDFSQGWYQTVGISIILTMLLNIVTPHMSTVAAFLKKRIMLCWDRGCSQEPYLTKVATQKVR
jgi:hypothetical protein